MLALVIATIIFAWAIYGLHVLDLHRPALEALSKPVADWFAEPGNPVRALLWFGAVTLSVASWLSSSNTLFNQMLPDFISISIAVIVIDQLVGYRSWLQEKKRIIQQMASHSNDFALDAVRQITANQWHSDGSLCKLKCFHANLDKAHLSFANLSGAELSFSSLIDVKLNVAILKGINLEFSDLTNAQLLNANLEGATLFETNFTEAHMRKSNLRGVNLVNATLKGTELVRANLENADLSNANLEDAILHQANLRGAKYNKNTTFPEGFDPEAAGAIRVDD